jgi:glycosyltransferase involved in cell wall biosynthesis
VKIAVTQQPLRRPLLGSVVIPAHDEAPVIRRCLDALLTGFGPGELDVVVVCNGCRDGTAARARAAGHAEPAGHAVRVVELGVASKPAALRAGDGAARAFPRLYVDADVVVPGAAARLVLKRLRAGALAARPPIRYDSSEASAPVRSYYRARSRVPAVLGSLWGAGVYGLSEAGRRRFASFPDVVADDLWVDRLFDRSEVEIVDCPPVVVAVPRRSRDLVRVLRRAYRGKAETSPTPDRDDPGPNTIGSMVRDLGKLSVTGLVPALDAATYASFAAGARITLALPLLDQDPRPAETWERDDSSRLG